jgi:hypothetical protein
MDCALQSMTIELRGDYKVHPMFALIDFLCGRRDGFLFRCVRRWHDHSWISCLQARLSSFEETIRCVICSLWQTIYVITQTGTVLDVLGEYMMFRRFNSGVQIRCSEKMMKHFPWFCYLRKCIFIRHWQTPFSDLSSAPVMHVVINRTHSSQGCGLHHRLGTLYIGNFR